MNVSGQSSCQMSHVIAKELSCTDIWADDYNKVSYTCLTLHFINDNYEFNSRARCACAFPLELNKIAQAIRGFWSDPRHDRPTLVRPWPSCKWARRALPICAQQLFSTCTACSVEAHLQQDLWKVRKRWRGTRGVTCTVGTTGIDQCETRTTVFKRTSLQALKQECISVCPFCLNKERWTLYLTPAEPVLLTLLKQRWHLA